MVGPIVISASKSVGGSLAGKVALFALGKLPGAKYLLAAKSRGLGLYSIPSGEVLITLPTRNGNGVLPLDLQSVESITDMLEQAGYRRTKHWQFEPIAQPLDPNRRRKNLIVICGLNPMAKELLHAHGGFLSHVHYTHSDDPYQRYFEWRNRQFHFDGRRDYALLAIKPNPFDQRRKTILMAGLRAQGTHGACLFYSDPGFKTARQEAARRFATPDGGLELLLAVDLDQNHNVRNISIADPMQRAAHLGPARLLPIQNDVISLEKILVALERFPRSVSLSDYLFEITYRADLSTLTRTQGTWSARDEAFVYGGQSFECDAEEEDVSALHFRVTEIDGDPTLVAAREVVPVLVANKPIERSHLFFPIPPIRKGEAPRRFETSFSWPNGAHRLRSVGGVSTEMVVAAKSIEGSLDKLTFRLKFELPGSFRVQPQHHFDHPGGSDVYSRGRQFEYTASNVNQGTVYTFKVTKLTS